MSHGMNVFRILGDILHLFSFVVLILKIRSQRSCEGTPPQSNGTGRWVAEEACARQSTTQSLCIEAEESRHTYPIVSLGLTETDLPYNIASFTAFSMYLAIFKIIFIGATAMIIHHIMVKYKRTYSKDQDTFPLYYIVIPCLILAFIWNEKFKVLEILWSFSIYLEAVAIIPQLVMLQNHGNVESLTSHYIAALGGYRALYLINWIYRYATETSYSHMLVWVSGLVQTIIYLDFFYYYFQSVKKGSRMTLPTSV